MKDNLLFRFSHNPVNSEDLPHTYSEGCPVDPAKLLRLNFLHYDFVYDIKMGSLVIHQAILKGTVSALRMAFKTKYPIHSAIPLDHETYRGDDDISMALNNSSSFNYRKIAGTTRLSKHSYGLAVDINPLLNPYLERSGKWSPPNGIQYVNRENIVDGMFYRNHPVVRAFTNEGFEWGGTWERPDYHHFEFVPEV
jgi:hypothetical protein